TDQEDSAAGGGHNTKIEPVTNVEDIPAKNVTAKRPKRKRKKRPAVAGASGSSHPPKRLKGDHETSSGVATGGKSLSVIKELLASSILNAEAGVEAVATLPFITSSISATPEREGGDPTDSVTSSAGTIRPDVAGPSHLLGKDLLIGYREINSKTFHEICEMDYHHMFTNFNVGTAHQAYLNAKIENLKAQLLLKEAEAVEVAHLRIQVSTIEAVEKVHANELNALKQK
nr:hypothetical protein [Tanacetum cinerariifolium]